MDWVETASVLEMYALLTYSSLRPGEVARRYDKSPSAVSVAKRRLEAQAARDTHLAKGFQELAGILDLNDG